MPQSIETKEYSYLNIIDKDTLDAMLMIANTLDENTLDALFGLIADDGASGGGCFEITASYVDNSTEVDASYSDIIEAIENGLMPYLHFTEDGGDNIQFITGIEHQASYVVDEEEQPGYYYLYVGEDVYQAETADENFASATTSPDDDGK